MTPKSPPAAESISGRAMMEASGSGQLVPVSPCRAAVRFTPLSVHLIRAHGFYEGKGARYRLAPRTIAAMLRLI